MLFGCVRKGGLTLNMQVLRRTILILRDSGHLGVYSPEASPEKGIPFLRIRGLQPRGCTIQACVGVSARGTFPGTFVLVPAATQRWTWVWSRASVDINAKDGVIVLFLTQLILAFLETRSSKTHNRD